MLPLAVFLLIGSLEVSRKDDSALFGRMTRGDYPLVYTVKILLAGLAIVLCWPAYREFSKRISGLAIAVGVVGAVVWIALATLNWESQLGLDWLARRGERVGYNPFDELGANPALLYGFLAIRFFGLTVVVAIAEEMFLRGFLIRYVEDPERWSQLPIGQAGWPALIAGTIAPMLMHPGELLAALVWFSLVTWLMLRTRSLWNCIIAHAVTNLLLGVYVVATGHWEFW